jgi:hypothetical protein
VGDARRACAAVRAQGGVRGGSRARLVLPAESGAAGEGGIR